MLSLNRRLTIAAAVLAAAAATGGAVADPAAPSPTTGAVLENFGDGQLFRVLGQDVESDSGVAIGRIVDLVVDKTGKPRAAIVDFGGFLGVGSRKIPVAWDALHFWRHGRQTAITVDLDRDQIKAAPEYDPSRETVAVIGVPKVEEGR